MTAEIAAVISKLSALTETYQDASMDGETVASGKRECESRWNMIERFVAGNGKVILDIGSSLGYFPIRIARENPGSIVVSFESDAAHCEVQRMICEKEGLFNMVICQHRLTRDDVERWSGCVECIDVALLMSVLHHYPADDVKAVFSAVSGMAAATITEIPHPEETRVCGMETLPVVSAMEYGRLIGETKSHLEDRMRPMFLHESKARRENLDAYIGVEHEGRHKFEVEKDGRWRINGGPVKPGLNVWNLLHFNIVWPPEDWFSSGAVAAYDKLPYKSDVRPWNLLLTPGGLVAIDYETEFPPGSSAEFHEDDISKLKQCFSGMKPINLWK